MNRALHVLRDRFSGLRSSREDIDALDEATSALDPAAEARLVERLRDAPGRLIIAITHRLALARVADHVVVMGAGRVLEQGPPDELLSRNGALRALAEAEDGRPAAAEAP